MAPGQNASSLLIRLIVCLGERGVRHKGTPEDSVAGVLDGHITEEILEAYSLGQLTEVDIAPVEEHILICPACQERLQATDLFVATIRHVLRERGVGTEASEGNGSGNQD